MPSDLQADCSTFHLGPSWFQQNHFGTFDTVGGASTASVQTDTDHGFNGKALDQPLVFRNS